MRKQYIKKEENKPLKFDSQTLGHFCRYVLSENEAIHIGGLTNLRSLLKKVSPEVYNEEPANKELFNFILDALHSRIVKNYNKREYIIKDVQGVMGDKYPDIQLSAYPDITLQDVDWIEQVLITPYLNASYVFQMANDFKDASLELLSADSTSITDKANALIKKIKKANEVIRKNEIESDDNNTLDLSDPNSTVLRIVHELQNPSHILKTGMQSLNMFLGGGFEGGRVYCFFGLPGEGKSIVLKNLAVQIKKNNKGYKCNDSTKKPVILYLTMENQVSEEFSTLLKISGFPEDIKYSKKGGEEIIQYLKESALSVNAGDINIVMKYKPINSIDTSAIYTMIEDESDRGNEVICVIQDYLKRIKPVEGNQLDERFRLGNVINEFKNCAIYYNIPIITASQLNRDAANKVDSARTNEQWDRVLGDIGRGNIGESSLIDENLDASIILAPVEKTETNEKYMGFKLTKNRYGVDISKIASRFNQPFDESKVRLIEDINCFSPASIISLQGGNLTNMDNDKAIKTESIESDGHKVDDYDITGELQKSSIAQNEINSNKNKIEPFIFYDEDELSEDRKRQLKEELLKNINL